MLVGSDEWYAKLFEHSVEMSYPAGYNTFAGLDGYFGLHVSRAALIFVQNSNGSGHLYNKTRRGLTGCLK